MIVSVEMSLSVNKCASARVCRICKGITSARAFVLLDRCWELSCVHSLTQEKLMLGIFTTPTRPHLLFLKIRILHEEQRGGLEVGTRKLLFEELWVL